MFSPGAYTGKPRSTDEVVDEEETQWSKADFSCGMGLSCAVKSPATYRWSHHVNGLLHIAILGGFTAFFRYTPAVRDADLVVFHNELWRWFFAAFLLACVMYGGMRIQTLAIRLVQRYVRSAGVWPVYFAAMAFSTSIGIFTTSRLMILTSVSCSLAKYDSCLPSPSRS